MSTTTHSWKPQQQKPQQDQLQGRRAEPQAPPTACLVDHAFFPSGFSTLHHNLTKLSTQVGIGFVVFLLGSRGSLTPSAPLLGVTQGRGVPLLIMPMSPIMLPDIGDTVGLRAMGPLFNLRAQIFRRKRINLIHNDFCFTAVLVPANHVRHLWEK